MFGDISYDRAAKEVFAEKAAEEEAEEGIDFDMIKAMALMLRHRPLRTMEEQEADAKMDNISRYI